jgi:hypothetical protein
MSSESPFEPGAAMMPPTANKKAQSAETQMAASSISFSSFTRMRSALRYQAT